jgi:MFS superfamily sulfate permease-like transporter
VGISLSEQAQLFLLQRRLKEIKNHKRNSCILGGAFCVIIALVWPYDFITGIVLAIFVAASIVWGVERLYRNEELKIFGLINQITIFTPKCSNCGKEIPQGNFDFCPFCSNSLKV